MRRALVVLLLAAAAGALAPPAQGAFGLSDMEVSFSADAQGTPERQAGAHPFAMRTFFSLNTVTEKPDEGEYIDGAIRDLEVASPPGLIGDSAPVPPCSTVDFLTPGVRAISSCPDSAAVGYVEATVNSYGNSGTSQLSPVYLLQRPPGVAAKLGFWVGGVPTAVELGVSEEPPHVAVGRLRNIPAVVEVSKSTLTLWGVPADDSHDAERGQCARLASQSCAAGVPERPFLTLPRRCADSLRTDFRAVPWWTGNPLDPTPGGATFEGSATGPGTVNCAALGFGPEIAARPTSLAAQSPSGLQLSLTVDDPALTSAEGGLPHSDLREAVLRLPAGMTANPALAEGLEACTSAQYEAERADSGPGEGCPQASKLGTVEVRTPLVDRPLGGSLYLAEPFENPFGTLIALYMVIRSPEYGVVIRQALKVEPDPRTGQLTTTASEIPQWPFSSITVRLREGARSPLVTPPSCGAHRVEAELTPWSGGPAVSSSASFELIAGPGGGPCPPAGDPPFEPGFEAGSLDNRAGAHSPFALRLTRRDGDRDLVRFDAELPPGLTAKLAGVGRCPEAAIAAIPARSGRAELADPSCPADSRIGTVIAGAGAGSQLTYVRGAAYLAGPYNGAPLSVVGVVPAVAGPFDVGVVAVRQALALDPVSAEVRVDGSRSQEIPHILAGIPLTVRDIRVLVDRPGFTLNPTSCREMSVGATLWGSFLNPFGSTSPLLASQRSQRFQAGECRALGFGPRLGLRLRGGVRRGANPALQAVYRPRGGEANLRRLALTLPRSEFVDQANFRTICTRVQFAAKACPRGSIYGRVVARTPLLEEPLRGPVYLRSSDNLLPDAVFDLHGVVDVEVAVRIDSVRGRLRATVERAPDVPVSKVVVRMQGGDKGLFVNSRNICRGANRARVNLIAQNNRRSRLRPAMRPAGCKKRQSRRAGRSRAGHRR